MDQLGNNRKSDHSVGARTLMKTLTFSLLILTSYVWCAESQHPILRIEKTNGQVRLVIDRAPFLMLNGQVHNSTTSNPEQLIKALDSLVGLHAVIRPHRQLRCN